MGESLKDDVCTQAFAVEHQSQRISGFETKLADFEAKVMDKLDKNLDVATRIDGALEKRIIADLRKDREQFEEHSMAELEEFRKQFLHRLNETQQLVQQMAQEQEDDRTAVRDQWTAHASKLELRFDSKFEDIRSLLNEDAIANSRQLAEACRAPPVADQAEVTGMFNKVDHDMRSLYSKIEALNASVHKLGENDATAPKFEALEARVKELETKIEALSSTQAAPVSNHTEKVGQSSPSTEMRMGTSLRREAPVSELTRQLQCSALAAELREQHLKENYATSAFAPRIPRARPSADEVKVRAEGDAVQLFDYG